MSKRTKKNTLEWKFIAGICERLTFGIIKEPQKTKAIQLLNNLLHQLNIFSEKII